MNDTFKISSSSIIILAFFGSGIQEALHMGSYQACSSWWQQHSSLMAKSVRRRITVPTVDLGFEKYRNGGRLL
jgi:hypothetical protein